MPFVALKSYKKSTKPFMPPLTLKEVKPEVHRSLIKQEQLQSSLYFPKEWTEKYSFRFQEESNPLFALPKIYKSAGEGAYKSSLTESEHLSTRALFEHAT